MHGLLVLVTQASIIIPMIATPGAQLLLQWRLPRLRRGGHPESRPPHHPALLLPPECGDLPGKLSVGCLSLSVSPRHSMVLIMYDSRPPPWRCGQAAGPSSTTACSRARTCASLRTKPRCVDLKQPKHIIHQLTIAPYACVKFSGGAILDRSGWSTLRRARFEGNRAGVSA